jgi:hypothetical protein
VRVRVQGPAGKEESGFAPSSLPSITNAWSFLSPDGIPVTSSQRQPFLALEIRGEAGITAMPLGPLGAVVRQGE